MTLCGSLSIAVLPAIGHALDLSAAQFGTWAGAGVHDVGQVTATASAYAEASLAPALLVKLTRVILLAPLVAGVGIWRRRQHAAIGEGGKKAPIVPLFVLGFLAMIGLRATGWLSDEALDDGEGRRAGVVDGRHVRARVRRRLRPPAPPRRAAAGARHGVVGAGGGGGAGGLLPRIVTTMADESEPMHETIAEADRRRVAEANEAERNRSMIAHGRRVGGLPGAMVAGAMIAIRDIYEGPKRDEAPVVVDAPSEPHDIDRDGVPLPAGGDRRRRRHQRPGTTAARAGRPAAAAAAAARAALTAACPRSRQRGGQQPGGAE